MDKIILTKLVKTGECFDMTTEIDGKRYRNAIASVSKDFSITETEALISHYQYLLIHLKSRNKQEIENKFTKNSG